jgi:hypothetical protein
VLQSTAILTHRPDLRSHKAGTSCYQSVSRLPAALDRRAESLLLSGSGLYQSVNRPGSLVTQPPPPAGGGLEQQESLYICYQKPPDSFLLANKALCFLPLKASPDKHLMLIY